MVYKSKGGIERAISASKLPVEAPKPPFRLECLSEKERVSEKEEESCARRKGQRARRKETEKEKENHARNSDFSHDLSTQRSFLVSLIYP